MCNHNHNLALTSGQDFKQLSLLISQHSADSEVQIPFKKYQVIPRQFVFVHVTSHPTFSTANTLVPAARPSSTAHYSAPHAPPASFLHRLRSLSKSISELGLSTACPNIILLWWLQDWHVHRSCCALPHITASKVCHGHRVSSTNNAPIFSTL